MIHQLKCESNYFNDAVRGNKTFEVRRYDRPFHIGDFIGLNEIDDFGDETGTCAVLLIMYVMDDSNFVKYGFVILGMEPCVVRTHSNSINSDPIFEYSYCPTYTRCV